MDTMLGKIVRLITNLPSECWTLIGDLVEKLSSVPNGAEWRDQLKRFLRKEPCWEVKSSKKHKIPCLRHVGTLGPIEGPVWEIARAFFMNPNSGPIRMDIANTFVNSFLLVNQPGAHTQFVTDKIFIDCQSVNKRICASKALEMLGGARSVLIDIRILQAILCAFASGQHNLFSKKHPNVFFLNDPDQGLKCAWFSFFAEHNDTPPFWRLNVSRADSCVLTKNTRIFFPG